MVYPNYPIRVNRRYSFIMSDAWSDIQALKNKQSSLREKLAQRKKQRQEVVAEIIGKPPHVVVKSGKYFCVFAF